MSGTNCWMSGSALLKPSDPFEAPSLIFLHVKTSKASIYLIQI